MKDEEEAKSMFVPQSPAPATSSALSTTHSARYSPDVSRTASPYFSAPSSHIVQSPKKRRRPEDERPSANEAGRINKRRRGQAVRIDRPQFPSESPSESSSESSPESESSPDRNLHHAPEALENRSIIFGLTSWLPKSRNINKMSCTIHHFDSSAYEKKS